jgi:citrate lyase subunit beta/citryl-CoA lyase
MNELTRPRRLRRSELSTPGSSPKMLAKAAASDADLVFCDLEDSVAPNAKAQARDNVVAALHEHDWGVKSKAVRINAVETRWAHEDVIDIVTRAGEVLDLLIVPKVRSAHDIRFVDTLLEQLEERLGLQRRIGLEVLIEETVALAHVEEIAASVPRLECLIFGPGDMSASQQMRVDGIGVADDRYPGDVWHYARSRIVVAARAAGIDAVDGPFANFQDPERFRVEAGRAATLGFSGKWAIHPSQIAIANDVFSPSEEELAEARRVLELYGASEDGGVGAIADRGALIDAASARLLRNTTARAELIGMR